MSFPATYDFNYYVGDTSSFIAYPEHADGTPFDLTGYSAAFVISDKLSRNPDWHVDGDAFIDGDAIHYTIHPDVGNQLGSLSTYFYDLEIRGVVNGQEVVYTLLKGRINSVIGVYRSNG